MPLHMPPRAEVVSIVLAKPKRALKPNQWNEKIPLSPLNPNMSRYKEYLYRLAKYQKYLVDLENYKNSIVVAEIATTKQYLLHIAEELKENFENRKRKREREF